MIAVDTNLLVHAHRADSSFHARAKAMGVALAEGIDAMRHSLTLRG